MADVAVVALVTLDSKAEEGRFLCEALRRAGARPELIDISLRPHAVEGAAVPGRELAQAAGSTWEALAGLDRARAAEIVIAGGRKVVTELVASGKISGAVGIGGANGTTVACGIMRSLPPLFPKVMVTPVAATAAVQWYVAESDIVMFPSIGDVSLNRITRAVIENAARAVVAMARGRAEESGAAARKTPLVAVSSFGGTAGCVQGVAERLKAAGFEVILFHASGPGGRALESLARRGELAGVVDVTTHELVDLVVGGVYSAGEERLRGAAEAGLPQVVVPGALDHANFWAGMVPERFRGREFFLFNPHNILMRTNAEEFEALGKLMAERLNQAQGPFIVLIPARGFSEHTRRTTHDLEGRPRGPWRQPETDAAFARSLRAHLKRGDLRELDLHINDPAFAEACAGAFLELLGRPG
ncbi:MAG: Tm-1-like ATP-binding domain-containing protein [Candidatus Rokubacteria bacterium]|nr:Tm-1-like ATP-binding domain-containing protein [Candidatus Rokubacteria bacterium]